MVLLFSFFIPAIVFTEIQGQSPPVPTEGGSGSATAWTAAATTAVVGWLVSPVITLLLPKIISCLGFDASEKLEQLQIHIIPELQNTLSTVDQERMMQRGKRKKSEVAILDKMALMLRHAREDAEDILDDAQEIELYRNRWWAWWQDILLCDAIKACIIVVAVIRCVGIFCHDKLKHRLYGAVATCKTSFMRLLQIAALPWSEEDVLPTRRSDAPSGGTFPVARRSDAASDDTIPAASLAGASDEIPAPVATPSDSSGSGSLLSCLCSFFDLIKNSLRFAVWFAYFLRDWTYEVVGITGYQENATALDFFITIISRRNLKKRIEKVESTVSEVKKSPLISEASKSAQEDIANKDRSRIRIASNHKVFGREALRDSIMEKLRETPHSDAPSSSASPCYSVIGIYGVAGSGKTTFARYIRDYIEEECQEKLFDTIMCIHVSETFSVDDIFHDMLKDITKKRQSHILDREELKEKLEKSLRGKRFFLILDDVWVNTKNDRQLEELISPLNVGLKGSKILVTAQTKVAAGALCVDEPKEIPDLDEDQYFSMFMHYAGGTSADDTEFKRVGRVIAEKLHGSPIAAVIVAGRLGANRDIGFWKNTAELDMLNDTMDALWWSYQHLSMDIRRCFEYCNIFPRRFKMKKENLVHLWIAHGFVKSSCAREDMEVVAERYIQELVSYSFLQPEGTSSGPFWYRIHDLLHDLADMVTGTDCSRIENQSSQRGEGWKEDVPRDVRHLFIQCYDAKLITEKIIGLENLHTLVIYVVEEDTPVEEKVIEYICKRLLKLRVLAISFSNGFDGIKYPKSLLIPKSISRLKHLRYLSLRTRSRCRVILPKTLNKLKYVQVLDFGGSEICGFNFANLITLRHIICSCMKSSNIGMLISLQTMKRFRVSNKQGYGLQQLRNLNKLRGTLGIDGLENVKSKEEALEANIAAKKRLTFLALWWDCDINTSCSPSDVQAEVLEGLYPPMGLQTMMIHGYEGLRYPDWMVGKQNCGPKDLQELWFEACTQLGRAPEFVEAFPHLRMLRLWFCKWDTLPDNMEHLTSLKKLEIVGCLNIWSLPTLPQSLEEFHLSYCNDEFMKSCKTVGHPNYQNIKHISRKMIEGETPLINEARLGPLETTECLLDHGTDPSIESNMGATALHHAAGIGHIELMKLLLRKGVDVESESGAGTPLVCAAGHGQQDAVKLLLEHNAKPNNETADGITPLESAIFAGSLPCLEVLIQAGANPNVTAGGATPMHFAAHSGNLEIIKCLLQAGSDPNTSDDNELKPIQVAALSHNLEVVEHLLPLTSPIPGVSNWTVDGIMEYTLSKPKLSEEKAQVGEAASLQRREPAEVLPEANKRSLEAKSRGDDAFRRKDFLVAVDAYTQAIEFDPNKAALFSNRSLCWLRAGQGERALEDARACRALRPDWAKACFREGAALRLLQRFDEAANAFYEGLQLKPENKELLNAFREVVEDRRRFHFHGTDKPANGTQSE